MNPSISNLEDIVYFSKSQTQGNITNHANISSK